MEEEILNPPVLVSCRLILITFYPTSVQAVTIISFSRNYSALTSELGKSRLAQEKKMWLNSLAGESSVVFVSFCFRLTFSNHNFLFPELLHFKCETFFNQSKEIDFPEYFFSFSFSFFCASFKFRSDKFFFFHCLSLKSNLNRF